MSAAHVSYWLRRHVAWSALGIVLGTLPAAAMPGAAPAVPWSAVPVVQAQAVGSAVALDQEPAPELFEATGTAMWDGRRTLQGLWVAHPLADSARRARIYNTETGAAVDGALFKRESSAGPHVLVSSEAAQALGMAPGDEVTLRIVALTPSQRPLPDVAADAGPRAVTLPAPSDDAPEATAFAGAAGVEPAGTGRLQPVEPAAPVELDTAAPGLVVPGASEDTGAAVANPARRDGVFRRTPSPGPAESLLAERAPAEPTLAPAAPTLAAPTLIEPGSGTTVAAPPDPVDRAAPALPPTRPAADGAGSPPRPAVGPWEELIASEPVPDDPAGPPPADVLLTPPTADGAAVPTEPAARPSEELIASAPVPDDPAGSPPADALLARPYVQAGIFGVTANAERLIARLRDAELPALGKPTTVNGRPATRVLAGPFTAPEDRDAALRMIRRMGLSDALPVAR